MTPAIALLWLASATAPDAEIASAARALTPWLVETRRDLHMHPELSNREQRTGKLVADRLRTLGLTVRYPVARNGVVAVLVGGRPGGVVAVRADMDALPIDEKSDVPYKSQNPGVMHACGHDAHTAIGLGTAEVLAGLRAHLPGTVVFLFQPAEEGAPDGEEGGAPLMVKEGALDDPKVEAIFGLHVGLGIDVGKLGWVSGPVLASADTFSIEVDGRRAHGAYPHLGLDPIPVAAEIVQALQLVVSRQIDASDAKVLTIGSIHGGNRFNILAERVVMQGTIRALNPAVRATLKENMARTVKGVAEANGTTARLVFQPEGNAPTVNDPGLARAMRPSLERALGPGVVIEAKPQMPAEDFSVYAQRVPGLFLMLGARNEAKGIAAVNHTDTFDIDEAALPLGVRTLATLAWDFLASRAPKR